MASLIDAKTNNGKTKLASSVSLYYTSQVRRQTPLTIWAQQDQNAVLPTIDPPFGRHDSFLSACQQKWQPDLK